MMMNAFNSYLRKHPGCRRGDAFRSISADLGVTVEMIRKTVREVRSFGILKDNGGVGSKPGRLNMYQKLEKMDLLEALRQLVHTR